ncbi:hypothetical protein OIU78_010368 [Salix suchowensis]|nr:hypothetical protein OIU78_010368 [Salix suchowensis]
MDSNGQWEIAQRSELGRLECAAEHAEDLQETGAAVLESLGGGVEEAREVFSTLPSQRMHSKGWHGNQTRREREVDLAMFVAILLVVVVAAETGDGTGRGGFDEVGRGKEHRERMVLELKLDIGDEDERGVLKRIGGRSWEEWSPCCWQAAVSLSLCHCIDLTIIGNGNVEEYLQTIAPRFK